MIYISTYILRVPRQSWGSLLQFPNACINISDEVALIVCFIVAYVEINLTLLFIMLYQMIAGVKL